MNNDEFPWSDLGVMRDVYMTPKQQAAFDRIRNTLESPAHKHLRGGHLHRQDAGCFLCNAINEREQLRAELTRLRAQVPDDTRRMDWLCGKCVEVRQPMVYGSWAMFHAVRVSEDDEEHFTSLREQVDAAMLSAAPTPQKGVDGG